MSKNPKPTAEELKFVYNFLQSGYEDQDILYEYAQLYEAGTLNFPYRVDKRFIRERRKEHYDKLAEVAFSFLASGLDTIQYGSLDIDTNIIYDFDMRSNLTRNELIGTLEHNIFQSCDRYSRWLVMDCLGNHLQEAYFLGQEMFKFLNSNPVEFINIIRTLAHSKLFKGNCPICEDW